MKNLDNLFIVAALGLIACAALFHAVPDTSEKLITLIVGVLGGYLARALSSPSKNNGANDA